ncbi:hypothetical protein CK203_027311 [Vitis vinifera]|uniref:Uncharacterized protein n=1 Tax=Vitis vinifera TaxID=29760 RepID=A0A438J9G9_VITVI|nr:hypothetical protein CK203_027311 [Vitis vinifera]
MTFEFLNKEIFYEIDEGDCDYEIEEVVMADFERRQMKQAMKESRRIFEEGGQKHPKGVSSSQPSNDRIKRRPTRSFSVREGASMSPKGIDPYMFPSKQKSIKSSFSTEGVKKMEAGPSIKGPKDTKLEIHIWKSKCKSLSNQRLRRVIWNPCKEYTRTGHPDTPSEGIRTTFHPHIRIVKSLPAIAPGCRHASGILLPPTFHSDVHIRNSSDAGWERERFNFPRHTYSDPLIAFLHSAAMFS